MTTIPPIGEPMPSIPLKDGSAFVVTTDLLNEFKSAYPRVDIRAEIAKARVWCLVNPANRKTRYGIARFLNSWLSRAATFMPATSGMRQIIDL